MVFTVILERLELVLNMFSYKDTTCMENKGEKKKSSTYERKLTVFYVHSEDCLQDIFLGTCLKFKLSEKKTLLLLKPSSLTLHSSNLPIICFFIFWFSLMSLNTNLKLLTINARGLRDNLKRKAMFLYCKSKSLQCIFVCNV